MVGVWSLRSSDICVPRADVVPIRSFHNFWFGIVILPDIVIHPPSQDHALESARFLPLLKKSEMDGKRRQGAYLTRCSASLPVLLNSSGSRRRLLYSPDACILACQFCRECVVSMAIPLRRRLDLLPVDRSVNVCSAARAPLFRKSETAGKRRQGGQKIYWGPGPPAKLTVRFGTVMALAQAVLMRGCRAEGRARRDLA